MKEWWRREKNKWLITNTNDYLEELREGRAPTNSFGRAVVGMVLFAVAVVAVIALIIAVAVMILLGRVG